MGQNPTAAAQENPGIIQLPVSKKSDAPYLRDELRKEMPNGKKGVSPTIIAQINQDDPEVNKGKQNKVSPYEGTHANKDAGVNLENQLGEYKPSKDIKVTVKIESPLNDDIKEEVVETNSTKVIAAVQALGNLDSKTFAKTNENAANLIQAAHDKIKDQLSATTTAETDLKTVTDNYKTKSADVLKASDEALRLANVTATNAAVKALDDLKNSQSLRTGTKYNAEIRKVITDVSKEVTAGTKSATEAVAIIEAEITKQMNHYSDPTFPNKAIVGDVTRDLNKVAAEFTKTQASIKASEVEYIKAEKAREKSLSDFELENGKVVKEAADKVNNERQKLVDLLDGKDGVPGVTQELNSNLEKAAKNDPQLRILLDSAKTGQILALSPEQARIEMDPEVIQRRELRRGFIEGIKSHIDTKLGADSFLAKELQTAQELRAQGQSYAGVDREQLKSEIDALRAEKRVKGADNKAIDLKIKALETDANLIDRFFKKIERPGKVIDESTGKEVKGKITFMSEYDEMTAAYLYRREIKIASMTKDLSGEEKEAKAEELRRTHMVIDRQHVQEGHEFGIGENGERWASSLQFNTERKRGGDQLAGLDLFLDREHATTTGYGTHQVSVLVNPGPWFHKEAGSHGIIKGLLAYGAGQLLKPVTDALGIGKFISRAFGFSGGGGSLPIGDPGGGGIGFIP